MFNLRKFIKCITLKDTLQMHYNFLHPSYVPHICDFQFDHLRSLNTYYQTLYPVNTQCSFNITNPLYFFKQMWRSLASLLRWHWLVLLCHVNLNLRSVFKSRCPLVTSFSIKLIHLPVSMIGVKGLFSWCQKKSGILYYQLLYNASSTWHPAISIFRGIISI